MNEKDLVEKAKKGNKQALAELVKSHEMTVYNFAFKICRNKDQAEKLCRKLF